MKLAAVFAVALALQGQQTTGTLIRTTDPAICLAQPTISLTYVVCPPTPENRIKALEAKVRELEAMVAKQQRQLAPLLEWAKRMQNWAESEAKRDYPGFVDGRKKP